MVKVRLFKKLNEDNNQPAVQDEKAQQQVVQSQQQNQNQITQQQNQNQQNQQQNTIDSNAQQAYQNVIKQMNRDIENIKKQMQVRINQKIDSTNQLIGQINQKYNTQFAAINAN
jgi:hypothetical protein